MEYFKKYHSLPIIAGFLAMALCNYSQYQISSLSYLVIDEYSLTTSQYAQIFTSTMLPGVFLSLVLGILCDRFGLRRSFGAAIVLSGLGLMGRAFCTGYGQLMVFMILSGIAVSFANSNAAKLVGSLYPADRADSIMGMMLVGSSAGMMFSMLTSARFFHTLRSAYVFAAVIFGFYVVYWFVCCSAAPGVTAAAENTGSGSLRQIGADIKVIARSPRVRLIALALCMLNGGLISVSSFLPLALQEGHGLDAVASSTVTSLVLLGNMIGTVLGPRVIRSLKTSIYPPMILSQILAFAGLSIMLLIRNTVLLYILSLFTGIMINAIMSILFSLPLSLPEIGIERIGTCGGVIATLQLLGAVIVPTYVVPNLSSSYPRMVFYAGFFFLIDSICLLLLQRSMRSPQTSA